MLVRMTKTVFREAIENFIRAEAKPPDKLSHQQRLYELAVQLAGKEAFDDDVLHAAIWLHDVGVFIGHRPEDPVALAKWDNVAYAVQEAPAFLRRFDFPADKIQAVVEAIRTHLPSGKPTTFEGTLLRDADIFEQLGAVGILRTVSKVGRDSRFVYFEDALKVLQRNVEQLPAQLRLESAKALVDTKLDRLRGFLNAARIEGVGG